MTLHLALATGGWMVGWYLLWRIPTMARAQQGPVPDYAVVVPARNEVSNIGPLVTQVLAQETPPVEIVVVDDGSTDGTGDAARAAGARVISVEEPPAGWRGKNWACQVGATETTAPLLVFLDADVRVAPSALGSLARSARGRRGLFSVVPFHRVERPYEWLSLFFGIVSIMGVGLASARRSPTTGAFGPCLAITRADYDAIGGHASVAGDLIDDMALAAQTTASGLDVRVVGGGDEITYRMYPNGPATLVEGWTKNIASGAGRIPPARSAAVGLWVAGAVASLLVAASAPMLGVVVLGLWVAQLWHHARQVGSFPFRSIVVFPLLLVAFCAIFVRSLYLAAFRRPVRWRGRELANRPSVVEAGQ